MSQPTEPQPRAGRPLPLIVSVCLNIALIALIAAAVASSVFHHPRPRWAQGPLGLNALMDAAKPDERSRIEAIIESHKSRLRDLAKNVADERAAALGIFAQPTFDKLQYEKALDQARLANDALQAEVGKMMVEAVSQLSPQERREVAERAHRSFWHSWHHRHFLW